MSFNAAAPVYGQAAVAAVKEFQRRNKLDDDGKVGNATWAKLDES
jgi:peptidoglycan hydrolase-like protein with peptidoglycan-binding domain